MRILFVALIYIGSTILASERIPIAGISPSKKYYQIEALNAEQAPQSFLVPIELIQESLSFRSIPDGFVERAGIGADDSIQAYIKSDVASYESLWFFFNHLLKNYHSFCVKKRAFYAVELAQQFEKLSHDVLQAEQILLSDFFMIDQLKKLLILCKKTGDDRRLGQSMQKEGKSILSFIPTQRFDDGSITCSEIKLEGMEIFKLHENGTKFFMKPHQAMGIHHESWRAFTNIRIVDETDNPLLALEGTFYEKDDINPLSACMISANKKSALVLAQDLQVAHPIPQILVLEEGVLRARLENALVEAFDWAPSSEHFMRIIQGHNRHHTLELYNKKGVRHASHDMVLPVEKIVDATWSADGQHLYVQEKSSCKVYQASGALIKWYEHAPAFSCMSRYLTTQNKLLSLIVPEKTNNPPQVCIFDHEEQLLMTINGPRELKGCKATALLIDDSETHVALPFYKNKSTSFVWLLELPQGDKPTVRQSIFEINNILSTRWAPLSSTLLITSLGKKKYGIEYLQEEPRVILCTGQDAMKDAAIDVTGSHIFIPLKTGSNWLLQHYIHTYMAHEYAFGGEKFIDMQYHKESNTITCFSRSLSSKERLARIFSPEHPDILLFDDFTSAKDIHACKSGIIFRDNNSIKEIMLKNAQEEQTSIYQMLHPEDT